ncbi:hypothetical protein Tco_1352536 [Tanacetum coccineum]
MSYIGFNHVVLSERLLPDISDSYKGFQQTLFLFNNGGLSDHVVCFYLLQQQTVSNYVVTKEYGRKEHGFFCEVLQPLSYSRDRLDDRFETEIWSNDSFGLLRGALSDY